MNSSNKRRSCQQLIRALFLFLVSIHALATSSSTSNNDNHRSESDIDTDIAIVNLPHHLRGKENSLEHNLTTTTIQEDTTEEIISTPWYHPSRILSPLKTCPWPDITSLANVRSGQYGSETGDCFYMYYDPSICGNENKCPLYSEYIIFYSIDRYVDNSYLMFQHLRLCICCLDSTSVYVDGTENAGDIDERDSTYMVEMAKRGYVAVTVDYGKSYLNSCVIDC